MEPQPRQIFAYLDRRQKSPFVVWLKKLKDLEGRVSIGRRILRLKGGLFGDCKRFGDITELRVDTGPGYRVYLGQDGPLLIVLLIVLLIGGDKGSQKKDFQTAKEYWNDYQACKTQAVIEL